MAERKELYDTNASLYVLSCLMHNPLLLQDEHYAFVKTDFYKPLQQMVFYAVFNMAQNGVEKIVPQDIDLYIHQYDSQYAYYKENKGYEFVLQCYQTSVGSDDKQFQYYYNRLKKFSMLRDLENIGIDTTEFYDTNKILNKDSEDEKLNKTTLNEIPEFIRARLVEIENRHVGKDQGTSQDATKGMRALVKELQENPEVGLPLDGDMINWATRGARKGKMYIYSAPSGGGKTRYMVGNACAISMPYINDEGEVVVRGEINDDNSYQKILFVATEMKADEIQTLILAHVSGVNEKKIVLGKYTEDEYLRITRALDIIDRYGQNFIIECIPDPSIAMLKARLAKYIVQDEVEYIFYDYIFTSPSLITEFSSADVKEHVALMMLSNTLKEIAMNYNVFIQSATQLNDGWSKTKIGLRDQNSIRGSKAIADKVDIGLIGIRMIEEERQQIDAIWGEIVRKRPELKQKEPNIVIDLYKNRRGDLNYVKVFRHFDFGTCRAYDLFMTDSSYHYLEEDGRLEYKINKYDFLDLKTRKEL